MITAVVGPPGSGKTVFMTYSALTFYNKDYRIYSNFNIYNPITKDPLSKRIVTTNDLDRARNGRLEIDEIAAWLDSRFSMSDQNAFVNSVLQKNRKRDLSLEWSAQDFWMTDIRLRVNTDYVVVPEIYYLVNDQEFKIKQSYFNPVNLKLLLPYAHIRAKMFSGWKYQNEKYLSDRDVMETFEFKITPISGCYDTSEEVKELLTSEMKKGIENEKAALEILITAFPDGNWKRNPESGIGMNSFDIEGYRKGELCIIDATTLIKRGKERKYSYLGVKGKDLKKYQAIEESRKCKTFFMFLFSGDWYLLPSRHVWDHKTETVPIRKLFQFCEKIS